MKKVLIVFGTRPEAIKMCPLVLELKKRKCVQVFVCVTGQHKEMLRQVLDVFDIEPDFNLDIMQKNQTLTDISANILIQFNVVLDKVNPDLVLVHGDTSTAFVCALSSFYKKIPVGHVEAGLRTYDIYSPYPEEFNRRAISIISSLNFAPTSKAKNNLIREGVNPETIHITGNTVFDSFDYTLNCSNTPVLNEINNWVSDSKLILVTAHRRENIGEDMVNMFKAILKIVENNKDVKVVYPVHLNPVVRELANKYLNHERIKLIEPLTVVNFHNLMKKSYLILTDSGGIQEEASGLRIPVLVMRNTTERPEGVETNVIKLVGTSIETIYQETIILLDNPNAYKAMANGSMPFGDRGASKRIADIIEG